MNIRNELLKVFFFAAVIALTLIFSMTPVFATAAYNEQYDVVLVQQDFENYAKGAMGTTVPRWTAVDGSANATVKLLDTSGLSGYRSGCKKRTIEMYDNDGSAATQATLDMKMLRRGKVSWWSRASSTNNAMSQRFLEVGDEIFSVNFGSNGYIIYRDNSGVHNAVTYSSNTWYKFVVEFDCYNDTYNIEVFNISGSSIAEVTGISFVINAHFIEKLDFYTLSLGNFYIDDVFVHSLGDLLSFEDGFEDYAVGDLGSASRSNGIWAASSSNVDVVSDIKYLGAKSVKILTAGSEESIRHLVFFQSTATLEAWIRPSQTNADVYLEGYRVDGELELRAGFGSNGQFAYYDGTTLKYSGAGITYSSNTWYKVQIRYNGSYYVKSYDFCVYDTQGNLVYSAKNADFYTTDIVDTTREIKMIKIVMPSSTSMSAYVDELKMSLVQSKCKSDVNFTRKEWQKLIAGETFEGYDTGNLSGQSGWTATAGADTQLTVDSIVSHSGKHAVKFYDNSTIYNAEMKRNISEGKYVKLEWWARAEQTNKNFYLYGWYDTSNLLFRVNFGADGNIYYNDSNSFYPACQFLAQKWYRFQIYYDGSTSKYDLYIHAEDGSGLFRATDLDAFTTGKESLNIIDIFSHTNHTGTFYVDDISVVQAGGFQDQVTFDYLNEAMRNRTGWKDYDAEESDPSWSEAFVMEAYLDMYDATSDTKYLDDFIVHANSQINLMDNEKDPQLQDYTGMVREGWGHIGNNSLCELKLKNTSSNDTLLVKSVRNGDLSGGTAVNLNSRYTIITITDGTTSEKFNLNVWYPGSHDKTYVDCTISTVKSMVNGIDPFIAVDTIGSNGRPSNISAASLQPKRMLLKVDNGLIGYTLARYLRIVKGNSTLKNNSTYNNPADTYKTVCEDLISEFNSDYVSQDVGGYEHGWYINPLDFPLWIDGCEIPHNRYLSVGRVLIEMYRAYLNDNTIGSQAIYQGYRDKAKAMARHFKSDFVTMGTGDTAWYKWYYWDADSWGYKGWTEAENNTYSISNNTKSYTGFGNVEDIGHSVLDILFVKQVYDMNSIDSWNIITDGDMDKIVNTFKDQALKSDGTVCYYIDGNECPTIKNGFFTCLYGLIELSGYDSSIFDVIKDRYDMCSVWPDVSLLAAAKLYYYKP